MDLVVQLGTQRMGLGQGQDVGLREQRNADHLTATRLRMELGSPVAERA